MGKEIFIIPKEGVSDLTQLNFPGCSVEEKR